MMKDKLFVKPLIRKFSRILYPEKTEGKSVKEEEGGGDGQE